MFQQFRTKNTYFLYASDSTQTDTELAERIITGMARDRQKKGRRKRARTELFKRFVKQAEVKGTDGIKVRLSGDDPQTWIVEVFGGFRQA